MIDRVRVQAAITSLCDGIDRGVIDPDDSELLCLAALAVHAGVPDAVSELAKRSPRVRKLTKRMTRPKFSTRIHRKSTA